MTASQWIYDFLDNFFPRFKARKCASSGRILSLGFWSCPCVKAIGWKRKKEHRWWQARGEFSFLGFLMMMFDASDFLAHVILSQDFVQWCVIQTAFPGRRCKDVIVYTRVLRVASFCPTRTSIISTIKPTYTARLAFIWCGVYRAFDRFSLAREINIAYARSIYYSE